ncbi:MAG: BMP family ABC transporter substrate-binding protein [Erysipelotrichaceae bacterium]|nr:BMP family ABC transporter substrate-binding protein [Erysipelotrichaceae bacterium]
MKKLLTLLFALMLIVSLGGCSSSSGDGESASTDDTPAETVYKIGMVSIGNEEAAYDRNFYMAADAATEVLASKGITVEWKYTYDHPEGDPVAEDNTDFAEEGYLVVFNNSYGMEPAMLTVAPDYPDTFFSGMTNENSQRDNLDNTGNAFPSIYEGRYLAGVAAGMKLNELIENGTITEDEALLGYVGAYPYAEVKSGYTAFYLGAKSVCPSATMIVKFINSWGNPTDEAACAKDLIDNGAWVISQHSDSTTPATTAEANGRFHVGYNVDMSTAELAPNASIISTRIDWTNYFVTVIETLVNGGDKATIQDYKGHGLKDGDVVMTPLNENVAAPGTAEAIAAAKAGIEDGSVKVFDTSTFTVGGAEVTSAMATDTDGDWVPDTNEAIFDGCFNESYFNSAPYFALDIDGITLLN